MDSFVENRIDVASNSVRKKKRLSLPIQCHMTPSPHSWAKIRKEALKIAAQLDYSLTKECESTLDDEIFPLESLELYLDSEKPSILSNDTTSKHSATSASREISSFYDNGSMGIIQTENIPIVQNAAISKIEKNANDCLSIKRLPYNKHQLKIDVQNMGHKDNEKNVFNRTEKKSLTRLSLNKDKTKKVLTDDSKQNRFRPLRKSAEDSKIKAKSRNIKDIPNNAATITSGDKLKRSSSLLLKQKKMPEKLSNLSETQTKATSLMLSTRNVQRSKSFQIRNPMKEILRMNEMDSTQKPIWKTRDSKTRKLSFKENNTLTPCIQNSKSCVTPSLERSIITPLNRGVMIRPAGSSVKADSSQISQRFSSRLPVPSHGLKLAMDNPARKLFADNP